jgi:hypothetical protein
MLTLLYLAIALIVCGSFVSAMFYFRNASITARNEQRRDEGKPPLRGQP